MYLKAALGLLNLFRSQAYQFSQRKITFSVVGFTKRKNLLGFLSSMPHDKIVGSSAPKGKKTQPKESDTDTHAHLPGILKRKAPGGSPKGGQSPSTLTQMDVPAQISLQVIETGSGVTGPCLLVLTDLGRYMFNCPEGAMRISTSYGKKTSRLGTAFFTHASYKNCAGIPSLSLTIVQSGYRQLSVYGPSGAIGETIEAMRPYNETPLPLRVDGYYNFEKKDIIFEDGGFVITPVRIIENVVDEAKPAGNLDESAGDSTDSEIGENVHIDKLIEANNKDVDDRSAIRIKKRLMKKKKSSLSSAFVYVCEAKPTPGKLSINKCMDLGVPVGPMLGQLKNGTPVTLSSGRVVDPSEVTTVPGPMSSFIVIEVPSVDFLDSLLEQEEPFQHFFDEKDVGDDERTLQLIVHMSTASVLKDERYVEWVERFPKSVDHLVLNEQTTYKSHIDGVYNTQVRLNMVHPTIFPMLPSHEKVRRKIDWKLTDLEHTYIGNAKCVLADPMLIYAVRPHGRFSIDSIPDFDPAVSRDEVTGSASFSLFEKEKEKLAFFTKQVPDFDKPDIYPHITFLGTGSAVPSKTRNVSSIFVQTTKNTSLILDAGEGTLTQMAEFFGVGEALDRVLVNIKLAFISHLHLDHQFGLWRLLFERRDAFNRLGLPYEKLWVIGPGPLFSLYDRLAYFDVPLPSLIERVTSYYVWNPDSESNHKVIAEMCRTAGLTELKIVRVLHTCMPFGIMIKTVPDMTTGCMTRIVYSGDTRPCPDLIELGKDCDLLIHEATFDDTMSSDAKRKNHCTIGEAVDVSKDMNAKYTILTHFSTRYTRIPLLVEPLGDRVGIAFDFMTFSAAQLPVIPQLVEMCKAVFWDYHDQSHLRNQKKMMRKAMNDSSFVMDEQVAESV